MRRACKQPVDAQAAGRQEGGEPGEGGPHGRCPCPGMEMITDPERGEVFCGGCGMVMIQRIEASGTGASRAGAPGVAGAPAGPAGMYDGGLTTVMGARNVDAGGHAIPADSKRSMGRLRTWDRRSRSKKAASLARALVQLSSITSKLAIPAPVADSAAHIYRRAVDAGLTRGRTTQSVVAASLYAACRRSNTPRTLDDMAGASNVEKRVLSRDLRTMMRRLELDLCQYDASSFVVRIANNLRLGEKTKRGAVEILAMADRAHISAGKNPMSQATAALYMACLSHSEPVTQKRLAAESGISPVTIRNRAAAIREGLAGQGPAGQGGGPAVALQI